MRTSVSSLAAVLCMALLVPAVARADNPAWDTGYPKPGAAGSGKILVKGTVTVAAPDKTSGGATVSVWPKDGGLVQQFGFMIPQGNGVVNWGESQATGLTSGVEYNVVVQITVKRPDSSTYTLATTTVVVKAP